MQGILSADERPFRSLTFAFQGLFRLAILQWLVVSERLEARFFLRLIKSVTRVTTLKRILQVQINLGWNFLTSVDSQFPFSPIPYSRTIRARNGFLERIEDGLVWRKLTWIKYHRCLACSASYISLWGGGGGEGRQAKLLVCVCIAVAIIFDRGRLGIVEKGKKRRRGRGVIFSLLSLPYL